MDFLTIKNEIYDLISRAKIKETLELMEQHFYAFRKQITLLKSELQQFKKYAVNNLGTAEQLAVMESRLNYNILNLLEEIEAQRSGNKQTVASVAPNVGNAFSQILRHQIDFLKHIIQKFTGTKQLLLVATIVPAFVFGLVYFFNEAAQEGLSLFLLIAIIVLLLVFCVCLVLLINSYIESFKHNKMTLRLHQSFSEQEKLVA